MLQEIDAFTLVIIGSGLIFLLVAIFFIIYYKYANKLMSATVKNNQLMIEHQQKLLKNEIEAIDKERERLARDLHDEVGALLSYISMSMSNNSSSSDKTELLKNINNYKENLDHGIEKIRQISHSLLPPTLDLFGLEAGIEEFIKSLDTNIKIDFSFSFDLEKLADDQKLHFYRLILEFVNNSVKHSKGDQINIQFSESNGHYGFLIADNGVGFEYNKAIQKSGMGLKNIEARLNALKADYTIDTTHGTKISVTLRKN